MGQKISTERDAAIARDFRNFVQQTSDSKLTPDEKFLSDENPFKAFREDAGYTTQKMADMMGLHQDDYQLMEEGEIDPEKQDIIRFCEIFNDVHPADIMNAAKPLSTVELDVLITLYKDPETLNSKHDKDYIQSHAKDALVQQANYYTTIDLLREAKKQLENGLPIHHHYTIKIFDFLLALDGLYVDQNNKSFEEPFDIVNEQIEQDVSFATKELERQKAIQAQHRNNVNDVTQRLCHHEKSLVFDQIKIRFINNAEHYPLAENIRWIKTNKDIQNIFDENKFSSAQMIGGKILSWEKAKNFLFEQLEYLQIASINVITAEKEPAATWQQKTITELWCKENADLFVRYYNRQYILAQIDLPECQPADHMAQTFPSQQKPLAQKFGL